MLAVEPGDNLIAAKLETRKPIYSLPSLGEPIAISLPYSKEPAARFLFHFSSHTKERLFVFQASLAIPKAPEGKPRLAIVLRWWLTRESDWHYGVQDRTRGRVKTRASCFKFTMFHTKLTHDCPPVSVRLLIIKNTLPKTTTENVSLLTVGHFATSATSTIIMVGLTSESRGLRLISTRRTAQTGWLGRVDLQRSPVAGSRLCDCHNDGFWHSAGHQVLRCWPQATELLIHSHSCGWRLRKRRKYCLINGGKLLTQERTTRTGSHFCQRLLKIVLQRCLDYGDRSRLLIVANHDRTESEFRAVISRSWLGRASVQHVLSPALDTLKRRKPWSRWRKCQSWNILCQQTFVF